MRIIKICHLQIQQSFVWPQQSAHAILKIFKAFDFWTAVVYRSHAKEIGLCVERALFSSVNRVSDQFRTLLRPPCDSVTLVQQVVVYFVCNDTVLLVLRMFSDKLPHPLSHRHQLTWEQHQKKSQSKWVN